MTTDETNTFVNRIPQNEPDASREFVVSPMVANVPNETLQDESGKWWCFGDIQHIHVEVYGVGATEEAARADFFRAALKRYQDLTVIDADALSSTERREIAYFRRYRDEAGRDGAT